MSYIEHKFRTHPEAKIAQRKLKNKYGYWPEIFKITDPWTGEVFYSVVEPILIEDQDVFPIWR